MNRIDRLMSILWTMQYKKFVSAEQLADKYNLSIRTIYRDIKALNEVGIPVILEPNKGYYIMQGYFLPPLLFTIEEANALLLLQTLAHKFTDKSIIKNSDSAIKKIKSVLRSNDFEKFQNFSNKVEIYNPENEQKENDYLSTIQKAIIEKLILKIEYTDNNKKKTQREIEPIGIIFYTKQWHLIAWCWLRKDYRDFKLNQILHLKLTSFPFKKEHSYSIQEYMTIF
ncbi:helix-turn-helix transcriptional regulator [Cellulophaga baltica]|uniref:HTH domain-containing protein n=1 Tax=Cellulophaga baltica TaxID=76594 RepID=A0A1G7M8Q8_9FLAO|nr:YafY family protein [Cellulophaga baltica]SDF58198.1 HTH domain-containing protein [Cellulophaga baltica]